MALPLLILVAAYVVADPFAVLRHPSSYYPIGSAAPRNRDFVSTETLLGQRESRQQDSFIFGSSRSLPFLTTDWVSHLGAGARPYHFDASLESLFGVWSKVRYLDREGFRLRNVLIVADAGLLGRPEYDDRRVLFRKHPTISGDTWYAFHVGFFQAFLLRRFFAAYADYALFHTWRGYMEGVLQRPESGPAQDPFTNDGLAIPAREAAIAKAGEAYFRGFAGEFNGPLAGVPSEPVIGARVRGRLAEMRDVFQRQGTHLRIVISPQRDRRPLSAGDGAALDELFGADNIADFSGDNWITRDPHNYYDADHYRVGIARYLMDRAYHVPEPRPDLPVKTGSR